MATNQPMKFKPRAIIRMAPGTVGVTIPYVLVDTLGLRPQHTTVIPTYAQGKLVFEFVQPPNHREAEQDD